MNSLSGQGSALKKQGVKPVKAKKEDKKEEEDLKRKPPATKKVQMAP